MATELQIRANRKNSLLSTGPKNTSVSKFNGIVHGLRANSTIVPGEDPEEFQTLSERVKIKLAPRGQLQESMVEQIAFSLWRLRRAKHAEIVLAKKHVRLANEGHDTTDLVELFRGNLLGRIVKYESTTIGQILRLLKRLRKMKEKENTYN